MYLTPTENHWACDIEADDLLVKATRIHCVCVENVITGEKHAWTEESKGEFLEFVHGASSGSPDRLLVGHNFIAYDLVMLNRFWGAKIPVTRVVDTYILSQIYNPSLPLPAGLYPPGTPKKDRKGPHSLEAWGHRLRFPKTGHADFSVFSEEMLEYCRNDTSLTTKLFRRLTERMRQVGFTEDGAEIEHLSWNIIQNKQRKHGFPFDLKRAHELYVSLRQREEELKNEIYKRWPPELLVVGEYRQSRKRDGEFTANYKRHLEQFVRLEETPDGGYRAYDFVSFNLGSPSQRIEKLLQSGWTPSSYTPKGSPQVDEEALLNFAESSGLLEVGLLARWIVINSRANAINTWMESYNHETGAIHGRLFIASTLRYRHREPNSANIPAVRLKKGADGEDEIQYGEAGAWTYESRDLWGITGLPDADEWCMVGLDGTGIQNRCLIHNLIKTVGEGRVRPFKELALEGDVHKRNIEVLGLANKAAAKKFYYTLMMGGGGKLLAADQAQFGTTMTAREGEQKKKALIATIPGFQDLIDKLQTELEKTGRIKLCDGTPVIVPSPHMVIPYLLQGDESRLMKKAMILLDREIRRNGLQDDVFKVADIHDEWQFKVRKRVAEDFVRMALPCFVAAGEYFNYLIRIDGDAKIGRTWAETH